MRATLAGLFMALTIVFSAAAAISFWGWSAATDTDRFMEQTKSLATNRTVQETVERRLVDATAERFPLAARRPDLLERTASRLTQSPAYEAAWSRTQRQVFSNFANLMRGNATGPLMLDLKEFGLRLGYWLQERGIPLDAVEIEPRPVQLADAQQVSNAKRLVDAFKLGRYVGTIGALVALLGVLVTASGFGSALLRVGICAALTAALLYGTWRFVDGRIDGAIAREIFSGLTQPYETWLVIGAGAGGLAMLVGLLTRRA